ncbi:MAG: hypothetical protein GY777_26420 [Candidatus Brocadiaceae bacterium]|nr:hypothetical protein [Candidatus Brocadiaceae bacterium]
MKKNILIITCCILLSFLSTRASGQGLSQTQDPVEEQLISLSVDFFKHMASSKYADASVLFHYPKEYTSEKKEEQILDVSKLLKVFTNEFGFPSDHKVDETPALYYNVAVSGGDTLYWEEHPSYIQVPLEVVFSKEDNGHVVILFANILDKWEIRAVAYGLPAERPGAKKRVVEIMTKMLISLEPKTPKKPTKEKYPIFLASIK